MTARTRFLTRISTAALVTLIAMAMGSAVHAQPSPPPPDLPGLWKNADTTIRITVQKDEVRGEFVEVGAAAAKLGFKPKEVSLTARRRGPFIFGEQVIRYSGNCYKEGRRIPVIGRLTPDGANLALHHYTVYIG